MPAEQLENATAKRLILILIKDEGAVAKQPKKQYTQSNYRTETRNVRLKIDETFAEKEIPANDSARLLDEIVEEMYLTTLWRAYKRTGRKPATNPIIMLKILLYSNM